MGGLAGLVAGLEGAAGAAAVVSGGFSAGALVAAFLFSAVIISVVKSALSLEYRTNGTQFVLRPDLSKTKSIPFVFHPFQHDVGDFLDDAFAHPHGLLLQLLLARLAKLIDLALHRF